MFSRVFVFRDIIALYQVLADAGMRRSEAAALVWFTYDGRFGDWACLDYLSAPTRHFSRWCAGMDFQTRPNIFGRCFHRPVGCFFLRRCAPRRNSVA